MKILSLHVKNFMSISDISINFTETKYELVGKNYDKLVDGEITSNGSGKTAILLALIQGLYNRVPRSHTIDTLNNMVTKKPYIIYIELEHEGTVYSVENSRETLSIVVTNNDTGTVVADKIKDSVKVIQSFTGLTYTEFINLSFITVDNISNMFMSDSNMILKHFDLTVINEYLSKLKTERTALSLEVSTIIKDLNADGVGLLNYSKVEVLDEIKTLKEDIKLLQVSHDYILISKRLMSEVQKVQTSIEQLKDSISVCRVADNVSVGDICPTCAQVVKDIPYVDGNSELTSELDALTIDVNSKQLQLRDIKIDYDKQLSELTTKLKVAESKLVTYEHVSTKVVIDKDKLTASKLSAEYKLNVVKLLIKYINDGHITTSYLHDFLQVFNIRLQKVLMSIRYDYTVTSRIYKNDIVFDIKEHGVVKEVSSLSGGETTLIGTAILVTFINTLQDELGISIPFIAFDEVFSKLDSHNATRVTELLTNLNNSLVFLVQHHNEVSTDGFTKITVNRNDGLSTI